MFNFGRMSRIFAVYVELIRDNDLVSSSSLQYSSSCTILPEAVFSYLFLVARKSRKKSIFPIGLFVFLSFFAILRKLIRDNRWALLQLISLNQNSSSTYVQTSKLLNCRQFRRAGSFFTDGVLVEFSTKKYIASIQYERPQEITILGKIVQELEYYKLPEYTKTLSLISSN